MKSERLIAESGYLKDGFAASYDRYRPSPPAVLLDVLCAYARTERPALVVDLGSGTGLSTRVWAERADEVVGIEPNPRMKEAAEQRTSAPNVRYVEAYAQETGLDGGRADVVTCSQSFHWMDRAATLAEAARLLRPGGVFAAYDYEWPPIVDWELEAAFEEFVERGQAAREALGLYGTGPAKREHAAELRASGRFRFVREVMLHGSEEADAERIVGMALTMGPLAALLNEGFTEEELGIDAVRRLAAEAAPEPRTCWFGYAVRVGIT